MAIKANCGLPNESMKKEAWNNQALTIRIESGLDSFSLFHHRSLCSHLILSTLH
jgi:hypothetical protein